MHHQLREEYRSALRTPLGFALYRPPHESAKLIHELATLVKPPLIITVGDFVTANLKSVGLEPNVAVVDLKTLRTPLAVDLRSLAAGRYVIKCVNPPGYLSNEAIEVLREAFVKALHRCNTLVAVEGEEDLLALPALVFAPHRSLIVYGLWLGASVVTICHSSISRSVMSFLERAFDPPIHMQT